MATIFENAYGVKDLTIRFTPHGDSSISVSIEYPLFVRKVITPTFSFSQEFTPQEIMRSRELKQFVRGLNSDWVIV